MGYVYVIGAMLGKAQQLVVAYLWAMAQRLGIDSRVETAAFQIDHLYEEALQTVGKTFGINPKPRYATERAQLGLSTILAAFVVVIAAFVVLIVVDTFDGAVGTPSSSSLSSAQGDILSGFGSMISLIEPLLLIAIGVVIIGLIRRVQS